MSVVAVLTASLGPFGSSVHIVHAQSVKAGFNAPGADVERPRGKVPHAAQGQNATAKPATPGFNSANPNCTACSPPLAFTAGKAVVGGISGTPGHVTVIPVYWAPAGHTFSSSYKAIINGYVQDTALASRQSTNVYAIAAQYYQQATAPASPVKHIEYVIQPGSEVDDTTAYPAQGGSTGCTADAGYTDCVTDVALQNELQARLTALGLPIDDSHLYVVLFPAQVETCEGPGNASCSGNVYCAYHNAKSVGGRYLLYANEPMPILGQCSDPFNGPQAPNGDSFADAEISLFSHEVSESITDWAGAWRDAAGYENGDQCAYVYGARLGSTGVRIDSLAHGTAYNQVIGNGRYYTQEEFSNADFALGIGDPTTAGGRVIAGCQQSEEAPVASFNSPGSVAAGTTVPFDGTGSWDRDAASGPISYSWSWGDGTANSTGATASHVFGTGNSTVTLSVSDGDGWIGSVSHLLSAGSSVSNLPCGAASVSSATATPQAPGVSVSFTASTAGCSSADYQFWLLRPGYGWQIRQPYGASTSWSWDTTGWPLGTYQVGVWARQLSSNASYETYGITTFTLGSGSCISAGLSPNVASPLAPGATVVFTASSNSCANLQYRFWLLRPGYGWQVRQAYSATATWSWDTTTWPLGTYQVGVWTKTSSSTAAYDAYYIGSFQLGTANCTSASILGSPGSPQPAGALITFSAGSGGCPDPRYQFWELAPGGSWRIVQPYGTGMNFSWNSTGASGQYQFGAWARQNGSANSYDSYAIVTFSVA